MTTHVCPWEIVKTSCDVCIIPKHTCDHRSTAREQREPQGKLDELIARSLPSHDVDGGGVEWLETGERLEKGVIGKDMAV